MNTQHVEKLKQFYAHFCEGNAQKALESCVETMTFQVAGTSPVAAKYTRTNFADFLSKMKDLTQNTYQMQVHDILASDLHGTVLGTEKFTLDGKTHEFRVVHVWRFEQGKLLAGYLYERDLHAFDASFRS